MHRAAGEEAARLRQLQRLHHHPLTGEGGIPVYQQRQDPLRVGVAAALLARAHRAFDHGIDDLEVRGVEREHRVHAAVGSAQVRGEALVILHIARAAQATRVVGAFELGEQLRRGFAEQVHEHVEPAAVRHADDGFLDPGRAARLDQVIEQRDERIRALEREALLPDILRMQVPLESLRGRELPEDVAAFLHGEAAPQPTFLEFVLQPQPLVRIGHVGELCAHRARIDVLQLLEDVAQLHALGHSRVAAAGEELRLQVRRRQAEVIQVQHPRSRPHAQGERIDAGQQVSAIGPHLDQARDGGLAGIRAAGR